MQQHVGDAVGDLVLTLAVRTYKLALLDVNLRATTRTSSISFFWCVQALAAATTRTSSTKSCTLFRKVSSSAAPAGISAGNVATPSCTHTRTHTRCQVRDPQEHRGKVATAVATAAEHTAAAVLASAAQSSFFNKCFVNSALNSDSSLASPPSATTICIASRPTVSVFLLLFSVGRSELP